jgi:hypothetical protein
MPLADKTRKLLWGKSGNKCSICRTDLSDKINADAQHTILGEECHIISPKTNGPRHDPHYPKDKLNLYENLILLCLPHHKIIDDNEKEYPLGKLKKIKIEHENWVVSSLSENKAPLPTKIIVPSKKILLTQTNSGREVVDLCCTSYAYHFENDDPDSEEEMMLIQDLFSLLEDCDVIKDQPKDVVQVAFEASKVIGALSTKGYITMTAKQMAKITGGYKNESEPWPIAYVVIRKLVNVINDSK